MIVAGAGAESLIADDQLLLKLVHIVQQEMEYTFPIALHSLNFFFCWSLGNWQILIKQVVVLGLVESFDLIYLTFHHKAFCVHP